MQGVEAYEIVSVFIGGGTPSVLKAEAIASIMETIQKKFCFSPDAEITIESNPGTVDLAKLNAYRESRNQPSESGTAVHGFERIEDAWKNSYI